MNAALKHDIPAIVNGWKYAEDLFKKQLDWQHAGVGFAAKWDYWSVDGSFSERGVREFRIDAENFRSVDLGGIAMMWVIKMKAFDHTYDPGQRDSDVDDDPDYEHDEHHEWTEWYPHAVHNLSTAKAICQYRLYWGNWPAIGIPLPTDHPYITREGTIL